MSRNEILAKVVEAAVEAAGNESSLAETGEDTTLDSLKLDSLDRFELALVLETRLGIDLKPVEAALSRINTLGELADLLKSCAPT